MIIEGLLNTANMRGGAIVSGHIPDSTEPGAVNIIGDPAQVKYSCYGYYNNSNAKNDNYAPISRGPFIRLYTPFMKSTIFIAGWGELGMFIHYDGEIGCTKL